MDKNRTIKGIKVFYREYGKGKENIFLLHGWGQTHAFWGELIDKLQNKYHVYTLDLPGFGLSMEPLSNWNISMFAEFIHKFTLALGISNPSIIGHSFGGRIAIAYAAKFPVQKLVLYSTGGGLPEKSIKKIFYKFLVANFGKYLFPNQIYYYQTRLYKPLSYENKILINKKRSRRVLDIFSQPPEDLREKLGKIYTKTLIITGSNDFISNPKTGKMLQKAIKFSSLVEIANTTHFAHIESPHIFYSKLTNFLSEK